MSESESAPEFQLDPVPPEVRAEEAQKRRSIASRNVRGTRNRHAQRGLQRLEVTIPAELIAALDEFQQQHVLGSRGRALTAVLKEFFEEEGKRL